MKGSETYDRERVHLNVARISRSGEKFEVIIDPDAAVAYKNSEGGDVRAALKYEKIFLDAKKGLPASEASMNKAFETSDVLKVAEFILRHGEIQLSEHYRESLREAKRKQIIEIIHRNAIDPRTKLPHPVQRIENAFEIAKVKIDDNRKAEDQLEDVIKALRPVMPISFETRKLQLVVPSAYASKASMLIKGFGRVVDTKWHSDGTLLAVVDIPAGLQQDIIDRLNKLAHGDVDVKVLEEK